MTDRLLRGRTLSFLRYPETKDDLSACRYEEDGGLLLRGGRIVDAGPFDDVRRRAGEGVETIDHRPNLILPGFVDCHVHMPQMQVIASYGAELLDWLNTYTFQRRRSSSTRSTGGGSRGCSSTRRCGRARPPLQPIARCTGSRPRPSSRRHFTATCSSLPAR